MCYPTTSNGQYLAGLENRRKSEWTLFQTGYYDTLGECWTERYEGSGGDYTEISNDFTDCVWGKFTSDITGKTFTIINQNGLRSGSKILPGLCNRASGAIILSGYFNGSTDELISLAQRDDKGSGFPYSNTSLYDGYRLKVTNISNQSNQYKKVVAEELPKGNYILIRFNRTTYGKSGSQWSKDAGHWFSILGYKVENGKELIFTGEPGWNNNKWYSIDEFENVVGNISEMHLVSPY